MCPKISSRRCRSSSGSSTCRDLISGCDRVDLLLTASTTPGCRSSSHAHFKTRMGAFAPARILHVLLFSGGLDANIRLRLLVPGQRLGFAQRRECRTSIGDLPHLDSTCSSRRTCSHDQHEQTSENFFPTTQWSRPRCCSNIATTIMADSTSNYIVMTSFAALTCEALASPSLMIL